jgi:hypothetical protein
LRIFKRERVGLGVSPYVYLFTIRMVTIRP